MKPRQIVAKLLLVASLSVVSACGDLFLGEDPANTPESNFDVLWETFDRHYSHFEIKAIDWPALYAKYRPQVHPEMNDDELFEVMDTLLGHLQDGHVHLASPNRRAYSDRYSLGAPRNFNPDHLRKNYLKDARRVVGEGNIVYAELPDGIGYVHLTTMSGGTGRGSDIKGWIRDFDIAMGEFRYARGVILDLRNNTGGRAFNAQHIGGRFADKRRQFLVTQSRNGPNHGDFTKPMPWYVEPGGRPYLGPVVVLTNRYTFSAAEWLLLAMKQFPHVTHIGTNTGGGLAMFLPRELPNGWTFTVSVQNTTGVNGESYEIRGIEPDEWVEVLEHDAQQGRDTLMERAMEILLAK